MPLHALDNWTIAWDLDGTLVDSAPDLVRALNCVLAEEGLPPADYADARNFVGHGAAALIERAWRHFKQPEQSGDTIAALTDRFICHYEADIAQKTTVFPGIVAALGDLTAHGAVHAVCTNKRTGLSVKLLEALGIASHFGAIMGSDSVTQRKPDAAHLFETVAAVNGDLSKVILVGDSDTDASTALAANIPFVLVSFGYSGAPLASITCNALVHSAEEAAAACLHIAAARI